MSDVAPTEIGHNEPPADADPLLARLETENADLIARRDELQGGVDRAPETIEDEETAKKMADFVQLQIDPFLKRAAAVHDAEKEPYLSGGRTVDGFWHTLIDDLKKGKAKLNAARKEYADKKAAAERRIREEEERKAREEADRLAKEAAEAEAKAKSEADLEAAVEAEEAAKRAAEATAKAERAADAKPAELGRTRGDHGGLTTLKQFWNFRNMDRDALDLEPLRQHLPEAALEQAIRSYVKAGGRELRGVVIFEDTRL